MAEFIAYVIEKRVGWVKVNASTAKGAALVARRTVEEDSRSVEWVDSDILGTQILNSDTGVVAYEQAATS